MRCIACRLSLPRSRFVWPERRERPGYARRSASTSSHPPTTRMSSRPQSALNNARTSLLTLEMLVKRASVDQKQGFVKGQSNQRTLPPSTKHA